VWGGGEVGGCGGEVDGCDECGVVVGDTPVPKTLAVFTGFR